MMILHGTDKDGSRFRVGTVVNVIAW